MSASDLRSLILSADDLKYEDVDVPEWGVKVRIMCMTGEERSVVVQQYDMEDRDMATIQAVTLVKTMRDPSTNEPIFTEQDDVHRIVKKSGAVLDMLFGVATRVSGITKQEVEAEAEKFPDEGGTEV